MMTTPDTRHAARQGTLQNAQQHAQRQSPQHSPIGRRLRGILGATLTAATVGGMLFGVTDTAQAATVTVTADLAPTTSTVSHVADGFLHGLSGTRPSESVLDQVGVRSLRAAPLYLDGNTFKYERDSNPAFLSEGTWPRVTARNPTIVGNLAYNTYNVPGKTSSANPRWFPGDGGDWDTWTDIIHRLVTQSEAEGFRGAYSIWNEPNNEFKDHGGFDRYLEAYKLAYRQIRTDAPSAKIVGPEINQYSFSLLTTFLTYAKANNVLPDILDWHALLIDPSITEGIPENVAQIKKWMTDNDISIPTIYITEYGACDPANRPSDAAAYIPELEAAGIAAAMKANWPACSGMPTSGNLPSAATADGTALTGVGQVYKFYNQMSGTRMTTSSGDPQVAPFGGVDTTRRGAWLMVANNDSSTDTQTLSTTLTNIPATLVSGGKTHLRLEVIPYSNASAATPTVVSDADVTVSGNTLTFSADLAQYQVFTAKLTPPTGSSAVQPTFVQIDDASSAVAYSSGWTFQNDASFYNNTKHSTGNTGATATVTFTGNTVRVFTKKDPGNGIYEVYIDNMATPVATVDAYSPSTLAQQVTYSTSSLSAGQHTLKIRVTGQKNPSSTGPFVGIDKIEVRQ